MRIAEFMILLVLCAGVFSGSAVFLVLKPSLLPVIIAIVSVLCLFFAGDALIDHIYKHGYRMSKAP
jgi:multisubunit Na+/H+ antiporter MnhC subunit